jgi:hypothetical protein
MSPTEEKMQPAIHQEKNPDIYRFDVRLFVAMYCGLHFLFRRAHYSCIKCVLSNVIYIVFLAKIFSESK